MMKPLTKNLAAATMSCQAVGIQGTRRDLLGLDLQRHKLGLFL
jgi:hypothetical protein